MMPALDSTVGSTSYFQFCNGTSSPTKVVKITTYSVVMAFSLIGNLLIVAVYYRDKTLRSPVHSFIVNMAVSDLLIPLVFLPAMIGEAYYDQEWLVTGIFGSVLCKVVWSVRCVSTVVSVLSMVAMAVDRFHAMVFPLKPRLISQKSSCIITCAIWIASIAFRAHYIYFVKLLPHEGKLYCDLYPKHVSKINYISVLGAFSIAAVVLVIMYSSVTVFLYREGHGTNIGTAANQQRSKENRKASCMLVTVVMAFFAVFSLFCVTWSVYYFHSSPNVSCFLLWFGNTFALLFTVTNFVVYCVFSEKYRKGFRDLLFGPWFCDSKCNDCLYRSVSPQREGVNGHREKNDVQVNNNTEHMELQEQCSPQGENNDPNSGQVNKDWLRTMNFRNNVSVTSG